MNTSRLLLLAVIAIEAIALYGLIYIAVTGLSLPGATLAFLAARFLIKNLLDV